MKNFGHKFFDLLSKVRKEVVIFFKSNVLFTAFVISSLINGILLRLFTVKNVTSISPIFADMTFILLVGSFGYFFKPKHRFKYYITLSIVLMMVCLINSIYYTNYISFTSFSLLATSFQIIGVSDALQTIMDLQDFSYIWAPLMLIFVHHKLKKSGYYSRLREKNKARVNFLKVLVAAAISAAFFASTLTGTDISRLYKQWNREYVVMKFGIYIYQGNDLIASLKPQISPLFGYDKAAKEFREYYEENKMEKSDNEYTDIFKDKNVLVIHAESIMNYLLDTEINGKQIAPNLKRLASEGMYFSNFYAQESVGTSSDTEFTLSTSLLPASSGTVFVSYYDRYYPSIQKSFKNSNYYVFSMHANKGNYWNREAMHKTLGYDNFYYYDKDYKLDDIVGLGLSDKSFFKQSSKIIKKIKDKKGKYYGTLLMLTNHTPFEGLGDNTDLDLTYKYTKTDGTEVVNSYLKDTTLGKYFTTSHYADEALGEFINELEEEGLLDDLVIVIYGDHDSKIKRAEYDYYYNYNPETDSIRKSDDPEYKEYTKYDYELNRKVPFIIWTKDKKLSKKINKEITYPVGMYDVFPTLANMFGVENSKYSLGHDVFNTDNHFIIFPNSNFLTDKLYYDSQNDEAVVLDDKAVIEAGYIDKYSKRAEQEIAVSNDIIVHDLIKKIAESDKVLKGE
ncbi:MAG: sulfatase-like hydrolase/transferase [Bacilli bacterium]|nr:sulfatase-like hydrolase/transferase [Bacilli bacterium]